MVPNRGRDVAALLIACRDLPMKYEYLCFTHDKQSGFKRLGQSFQFLLWENTLASETFIENIIYEFETDPRIGFMAVPAPYNQYALSDAYGGLWGDNYQNTKRLAESFNLRCRLSESVPTFAVGTSFWCRTASLKTLFEHAFKIEDFPEEPMPMDGTISHSIERILPYVAQHEGYFSGIAISDRYAEVRIVDLENTLFKIITGFGFIPQATPLSLYDINFSIIDNRIVRLHSYCAEFSDIDLFIYGTGGVAKRVFRLLNYLGIAFHGFVISDGHNKESGFFVKPVYWLSEVYLSNPNCGMILALSPEHTNEVLPLFEEIKTVSLFNFYD
jgi:rhamnosyltransferase